MRAYDEVWGVAEDNYGIITSAREEELGVSRKNSAAMEADRIADAAEKAKEKGLLADGECDEFQG